MLLLPGSKKLWKPAPDRRDFGSDDDSKKILNANTYTNVEEQFLLHACVIYIW